VKNGSEAGRLWSSKMYNLMVPSGIGDFSWIYSKFYNLGKKMNLMISKDEPKRLGPYVELLDLVETATNDGPSYYDLKAKAKYNFSDIVEDNYFCIEANSHLERGEKLENWFPELKTNYHYPIKLGQLKLPFDYIVLYTSSMGMIKNWNGWRVSEWITFIHLIKREFGNLPIVIIGAKWDKLLTDKIVAKARGKIIDYCGQLHICDTLSLIKGSKYFVSFPSGLGILSNVLDVPTTMFYAEQIKNIMGTWSDPDSNNFDERLYCDPQKYFRFLKPILRGIL
jgi:ADP-heptose:LPS heptosyltransferase